MDYRETVTPSGTTRPMTTAEIYVRLEELRSERKAVDAEWRALLAMLHPLKDEPRPPTVEWVDVTDIGDTQSRYIPGRPIAAPEDPP